MKWIKSRGGPLICVASEMLSKWNGNEHFPGGGELDRSSGKTDYERACLVRDYTGVVDLSNGTALVLGDAPLEISVWTDAAGKFVIVRLIYTDTGSNLLSLLGGVDLSLFNSPDEAILLEIDSSSIEIFDASLRGIDATDESLTARIRPANYRVSTKVVNPDERTSLVLHRFDILQ